MRISDWSSDVCSSDLRVIDLFQFLLDQRCDNQPAVLGHDLETVVEDRHGGIHVQVALAFDPVGDRRDALDFGQAQEAEHLEDRKSVVEGMSVSVSVDLGGRRIIKKTNIKKHET